MSDHEPGNVPSTMKRERIIVGNGKKYRVDLSSDEGGRLVCTDCRTGINLDCFFYPTNKFMGQLQLLATLREGVSQPQKIFRLEEQIFVLYRPTHGNLLSHLIHEKRLPEATAAAYIRQIVSLVASAHEKNICLRDITLKKFLFSDETR